MPESNDLLLINTIIAAERGKALDAESLLIESEMDSFSYAVFWLTLADHGFDLSDTWIDAIDYETLRVSMIMQKMEEHRHGTH